MVEIIVEEPSQINLKEKIERAVLETGDIPTLRHIISNVRERGQQNSFFNPSEMEWLNYKVDFLVKVVQNSTPLGIVYWLKFLENNPKAKINSYIISKKLGIYAKTCQYWIEKLVENSLAIENPKMGRSGNERSFSLQPKFKGLTNIILDIGKRYHGYKFSEFVNKNHNKEWENIKQWRQKNPEKTKKHRHKSHYGNWVY